MPFTANVIVKGLLYCLIRDFIFTLYAFRFLFIAVELVDWFTIGCNICGKVLELT